MSISANEFNKATITDSNPSGDKNCPMDAQHAATVHKITLKTLTEWAGGKWFTLHCEKKLGSAPTPLLWAFFFVIILGLCTNTNDNTAEIAIVDTTAVNVSKLLANKLKTFAMVTPAAQAAAAAPAAAGTAGGGGGSSDEEEDEEEDEDEEGEEEGEGEEGEDGDEDEEGEGED